jgi:hypothetical protein
MESIEMGFSSWMHVVKHDKNLSTIMSLATHLGLIVTILQAVLSASSILPADFQWPSQYIQSGESMLSLYNPEDPLSLSYHHTDVTAVMISTILQRV